jgi:hypothetical protein
MHACNRNINAINYAPYHQESTSLKKTLRRKKKKTDAYVCKLSAQSGRDMRYASRWPRATQSAMICAREAVCGVEIKRAEAR